MPCDLDVFLVTIDFRKLNIFGFYMNDDVMWCGMVLGLIVFTPQADACRFSLQIFFHSKQDDFCKSLVHG